MRSTFNEQEDGYLKEYAFKKGIEISEESSKGSSCRNIGKSFLFECEEADQKLDRKDLERLRRGDEPTEFYSEKVDELYFRFLKSEEMNEFKDVVGF